MPPQSGGPPPPPSTIVPVEAILDEHKNSVDEVAKIVQQLRVVLPNKVWPTERTVLEYIGTEKEIVN